MQAQINQSNLNTYSNINMNIVKKVNTQLIKCLMIFLGFAFSLNAVGMSLKNPLENLSNCESSDTVKKYDELNQKIAKNFNTDLVFSLGKTTACLGKKQESLTYFQKASDLGHIPATFVTSIFYYMEYIRILIYDHHIDNLNFSNSLKYMERAMQMIEDLPNYPEGTTNNTPLIEPILYVSHRISVGLPLFYIDWYANTIINLTNNNEEVLYDATVDTLGILNKIQQNAAKCLEKPALNSWKERKEIIYQAQQVECNALSSFIVAVYPLEQQRIEVSKTCTVPLNECSEHQELFKEIIQLVSDIGQTIQHIEFQVLPPTWLSSKI